MCLYNNCTFRPHKRATADNEVFQKLFIICTLKDFHWRGNIYTFFMISGNSCSLNYHTVLESVMLWRVFRYKRLNLHCLGIFLLDRNVRIQGFQHRLILELLEKCFFLLIYYWRLFLLQYYGDYSMGLLVRIGREYKGVHYAALQYTIQ